MSDERPSVDDIRGDLLGQKRDFEDREIGGHTLRVHEMTMGQFRRFGRTSLKDDPVKASYRVIFECVTTPDGREVFGPEHVDSILEGPCGADKVPRQLQQAFLEVNDLSASSSAPEDDSDGDEGN